MNLADLTINEAIAELCRLHRVRFVDITAKSSRGVFLRGPDQRYCKLRRSIWRELRRVEMDGQPKWSYWMIAKVFDCSHSSIIESLQACEANA